MEIFGLRLSNRKLTDFILFNVALKACICPYTRQFRWLKTSVRMLLYSMERFKVIMLIIDNKMCFVRIVFFHCFIIFLVFVVRCFTCFVFYYCAVLSAYYWKIFELLLLMLFCYFWAFYLDFSELGHWQSTSYSLFRQKFLTVHHVLIIAVLCLTVYRSWWRMRSFSCHPSIFRMILVVDATNGCMKTALGCYILVSSSCGSLYFRTFLLMVL